MGPRRRRKHSSKSSRRDKTVDRLQSQLRKKDAKIRALRAENRRLRSEVKRLAARLREIEARLGQNSSNSSRPPSSDLPGSRPRQPPRTPTGRKQGAQRGHRGTHRKPFPPDQVDHSFRVPADRCRACGKPLPKRPGIPVPPPRLHQLVDIPPSSAEVWEWLLEAAPCSCGAVTWADLPPDVPRGAVGERLQAAVAVLVGRFHLSRRDVTEVLVALFGPKAEIAVGTVSHIEEQVSEALLPCTEEAVEAVRKAPVAHADETGFRQENKKAWLWVGVAGLLAVFLVDRRRGRDAFVRLFRGFRGILVSDRWRAYVHWPRRRWQICWAHLKRDFRGVVDRKGPGHRVGVEALEVRAEIFAIWKRHKAGQISHAQFRRRIVPHQRRFRVILQRGTESRDRKTRALCRELLRFWPALWTFARYEGVDPTNNAAERALRRAVLWRKGSFGCQSERGARFVERILTVTQSLRMQGRSSMDFIELAIRAHQNGHASPSLIPNRIPRPKSQPRLLRGHRTA